jgi:hypothetical protein
MNPCGQINPGRVAGLSRLSSYNGDYLLIKGVMTGKRGLNGWRISGPASIFMDLHSAAYQL